MLKQYSNLENNLLIIDRKSTQTILQQADNSILSKHYLVTLDTKSIIGTSEDINDVFVNGLAHELVTGMPTRLLSVYTNQTKQHKGVI